MDGLLTDVRKKWKGLLSDAENLSIGMGHGISNQLEGMYQMAAHPVQSAKALYGAGKAIYDNPSLVGGLLSDAYNQATSGPLGFGQFVGENMSLRPRAPRSLLELTTYHGSPHRINNVTPDAPYGKFDLSKVGTGEGAQAYGHGVYLAEHPEVARGYARNLADDDPNTVAGWALGLVAGDKQAATKALRSGKAVGGINMPQHIFNEAADLIDGGTVKDTGHFYTVDLPDEHIAKMLDWDAPLSEQPEAVRKAVEQYVGGLEFDRMESLSLAALAGRHPRGATHSPTGEQLYGELRDVLGSDVEASKALRSLGIPGIKYFDGNSRAAGKGTRNFVIFDGDTAKILKRE